jgi:hypothetical protein
MFGDNTVMTKCHGQHSDGGTVDVCKVCKVGGSSDDGKVGVKVGRNTVIDSRKLVFRETMILLGLEPWRTTQ